MQFLHVQGQANSQVPGRPFAARHLQIPANFLAQELLQLFGLPPGNPLISFVGLSSKRAGPSY